MSCWPMTNDEIAVATRRRQTTALDRLNANIAAGTVTVTLSADGKPSFRNWSQNVREDLCDVCAFRLLSSRNSPELRRALARAESMAGRTLDRSVLAARA